MTGIQVRKDDRVEAFTGWRDRPRVDCHADSLLRA
jgi:hypothetical protein